MPDTIIRESITVDPISAERLDTQGNVHRYNFGWIKTIRQVGGSTPSGTLVEQSETALAGVHIIYEEFTTQSVLPPSLETPDVASSVAMTESRKVGSFQKVGQKYRAMVRARAIGSAEILVLGMQQFSVQETKEYANAIGNPSEASLPAPDVSAAEGGLTITSANGIQTVTTIKG